MNKALGELICKQNIELVCPCAESSSDGSCLQQSKGLFSGHQEGSGDKSQIHFSLAFEFFFKEKSKDAGIYHHLLAFLFKETLTHYLSGL